MARALLLKHVWPHVVQHLQPALRKPEGWAGRIVMAVFDEANKCVICRCVANKMSEGEANYNLIALNGFRPTGLLN